MPWLDGSDIPFQAELVFPLIIWSIFWKGLALWHAARRSQRGWYMMLLVLQSVGIVEIFYLIFVVKLFPSKKTKTRA